jgi:hypothetical protein
MAPDATGHQRNGPAALLHTPHGMWMALGVGIDLIHAFAMAAWVVGFPLLFVRQWRRARLAYAIYAVVFIVASQASRLLLGECFLTTAARWCWSHDPTRAVSNEWFTVRMARGVFGMAPSHRAIARLSEALVLATAAGVIVSIVRSHHARVASAFRLRSRSPSE